MWNRAYFRVIGRSYSAYEDTRVVDTNLLVSGHRFVRSALLLTWIYWWVNFIDQFMYKFIWRAVFICSYILMVWGWGYQKLF